MKFNPLAVLGHLKNRVSSGGQVGGSSLESIQLNSLKLALVLMPLAFFYTTTGSFDLSKVAVSLFLGFVSLLAWALLVIKQKRIFWNASGLDFPLFAFVGVSVISAMIAPNRWAALSSDALVLVTGLVIFLAVRLVLTRENLKPIIKSALLGAGLVSLWAVVSFAINLISLVAKVNIVNLPALLTPQFSATGALLTQAMFLGIMIPLAFGFAFKDKDKRSRLLFTLIAAGLAVSLYGLLRFPPLILGLSDAWKIATGALGASLSTALFGVGPGNYIDAFTIFKPLTFNNSALWNLRFSTGGGFYLYVLTTMGIAGLATFGLLLSRVAVILKNVWKDAEVDGVWKSLGASLVVTGLLLVIFPAPVVLILASFAVLSILGTKAGIIREFTLGNHVLVKFLPLVVVVVTMGTATYLVGRLVLADYYFNQASLSAAANRGTDTYNSQIKAIEMMPFNENYRISYSQTNLALADSLAGQSNLSDQQKQVVIQLVQQAIREGRAAASLAPNRSQTWENLFTIYRALINFAQDSEQWALAAQQQAISFDPTSPRLRLDLGGLYFAAQDFQSAAQIFNQAVNLKPDLANAHYNLAQALRNLNLNDQALRELQLTGSLVCTLNQKTDCDRVNAEIAALSKGLVSQASGSGELKTATSGGEKNLPKAVTNPAPKISSPSGEITQ